MEKIGMTKPKLKKNRITQVFASFLVLALSVTLTGCAGINRKESIHLKSRDMRILWQQQARKTL